MKVSIQNATKHFANFIALEDVSIEIASGQLLALLGPSGCGKTTLLRAIAGLSKLDQGKIYLGDDLLDQKSHQERQIGFVFQHYALFRHMTVFENIAFGLRIKPRKQRPSEQEITKKVFNLLELVQLHWLADSYPSALSGGQRQRIALARALAIEPKLLLLDEPFGALDAKVRDNLRKWLRDMHDQLHVSSVFVTHDQHEALSVADQVVLMNQGRVIQQGSPLELYQQPATEFVYHFLGAMNRLSTEQIAYAVKPNRDIPTPDDVKEGFVRPHEISLTVDKPTQGNSLEASVKRMIYVGNHVCAEIRLEDQILEVDLSRHQDSLRLLSAGQRVYLQFENAKFFKNKAA